MINAERIVRELDSRLDHPVSLVLYGRAALALGFADAPDAVKFSLDVDAIIPMSSVESFQSDEQFWTAQQQANSALEGDGLYITHLFEAKDVFLRRDWEEQTVPITLASLRWLKLLRPATLDLVLTKMMRGNDAQDMADAKFMIEHDKITRTQLEAAFAAMNPVELVELRDAFAKARPIVTGFAAA